MVMNSKDLPPLVVGIYRDGEVVSVSQLPDPRVAFCAEFNRMSTNATAKPLAAEEAEAAKLEIERRKSRRK